MMAEWHGYGKIAAVDNDTYNDESRRDDIPAYHKTNPHAGARHFPDVPGQSSPTWKRPIPIQGMFL